MFALVQPFDDYLLQALAAWRTESLTTIMKVVSFCGEWYVLLPAAAILVFVLSRSGFVVQATELTYAVLGTSIAVIVLKALIARPRPPEYMRVVAETGYSFPSWHAAIAIAFWGYLAHFALKRLRSVPQRILVISVFALIVLATDFSRLYLSVHYFSDVAAGTLFGGLILLIAI